MGLAEDVKTGIDDVLAPDWYIRNGYKVPEAGDIVLRNGAVNLEATYVYADMANSTGLAQNYHSWAVAKVVRCYLNAATRCIRNRGGAIRSFDGDRVLGIFVGDYRNDLAVIAAMNTSWAVDQVINPKLRLKWPDLRWTMNHGVGIDSGEAMLVRGGVFGDNDIVSIGSAPNVAAKLSEERSLNRSIFITSAVYDTLSNAAKYNAQSANMWTSLGAKNYGGKYYPYHGTSYWWEP